MTDRSPSSALSASMVTLGCGSPVGGPVEPSDWSLLFVLSVVFGGRSDSLCPGAVSVHSPKVSSSVQNIAVFKLRGRFIFELGLPVRRSFKLKTSAFNEDFRLNSDRKSNQFDDPDRLIITN